MDQRGGGGICGSSINPDWQPNRSQTNGSSKLMI